MPHEVGHTIENDGDTQRDNKFTEFLKKPENVATAIVFGLALTQPRGELSRGQALARRGIGALQLRGGLERGIQDRQIAEQERDRRAGETQQQIDISRRGVAATEERTATTERISAADRASREGLASDELAVQQGIQEMLTAQRADDMQIRLIDSFTQQYMTANQFDEAFLNLPMEEKLRLASNWAIVQSQLALERMGLETVNIGGRQFVDVPGPEPTPGVPVTEEPPVREPAPTIDQEAGAGVGPDFAPALTAIIGGEDIPQPERQISLGGPSAAVRRMEAERAPAIEDAKASFELGVPLEPETRAILEATPLSVLRDAGFTPEQIQIILRGE